MTRTAVLRGSPALLLVVALAGCHTPSFSGDARTIETENVRVLTDADDAADEVLRRLDALFEEQCRRWGAKVGPEHRRDVILFGEEDDFHAFRRWHLIFGGPSTCAGFYCPLCAACVTYLREKEWSLFGISGVEPTIGLLAHELCHRLVWERRGASMVLLPTWLMEGVAVQEELRAYEQFDGGFENTFGGHSAVARTLGALRLALRLFADPTVVDGPDDAPVRDVGWSAWSDYDLGGALCDALDRARPGYARAWVLDGSLPPVDDAPAFAQRVRTAALLIACEHLSSYGFTSDTNYDVELPAVRLLGALWEGAPALERYEKGGRFVVGGQLAADAAAFVAGLTAAFEAGTLSPRPPLSQRSEGERQAIREDVVDLLSTLPLDDDAEETWLSELGMD